MDPARGDGKPWEEAQMKRTVLTVACALLVGATSPGFGESVKKREQKEEHRIQRGVKTGKLTPKETNRLENQQETIERERQQAWEDGKMSKRERQDIKHDQNRLGHDIRNKKHNEKRVKQ
jgi:hypothetical protein